MRYFYPRPPRGGRPIGLRPVSGSFKFLSTPSVRRATILRGHLHTGCCISIHALREEGDLSINVDDRLLHEFLSTLSARRATVSKWTVLLLPTFLSTPSARRATNMRKAPTSCSSISIHALREEGDTAHRPPSSCPCHFYPCPPRGGRPVDSENDQYAELLFLSTPSVRRATARQRAGGILLVISIHALREEGDNVPAVS